jgi:nitrite reductase (NADH) small subunit
VSPIVDVIAADTTQHGIARSRSSAGVDRWVDVCAANRVRPGRGVAALVERTQVAVFRIGAELFAVANRDPMSGANVLSRGIVGSAGDVLMVTSPMYKHRFDLRTGVCVDDDTLVIAVHQATERGGRILIRLAS